MPERVLLVLGTATGGVGRHVASLAAATGATVACPASTQAVFGFDRHVELDIGSSPRPADVGVARALRRLAQDHDVIHAHGLRATAMAVLAGVHPLVGTWHNAVGGPVGRALERLAARRTDVTLAASPDLLEVARRAGGRDVRFAPVAAPPLVATGTDPGMGHPLVLAVGRLHPQKGYDVLLDALPVLADAVVAVAGDGPLAGPLRARAPQVRWLGRRDDIADLLAAADVVVLPSRWEARSLTAQEAMRQGRPLVCSAVGGLPDLVRDGAVLVPAGDAGALGAAVRRLLDDPAAAAALGGRARQVAAGWPDEAATVAQVRAVYRELLG